MLKSTLLLLLLFLLAVADGRAQDAAAPPVRSYEDSGRWEQVDDIAGRFRVLTPGPLVHTEDTLQTALGEQIFHTYFFKVPEIERAENLIYVLSYVDYPEGSLHQDSTELLNEFLVSTEEAAAESLSGEVIYATDRQVEGFPGRLWRVNYKDGQATARTLAFVIGSRYYELKTFSLTGRGLGEASDKFFSSFRYLGNP